MYVSMDACMASQLVTMRVRQRLAAEYGDLYDRGNVAISGTHTHASPAGFLQYVLYGITSLGFVQETFDAMVDGIVEVRGLQARKAATAYTPCILQASVGTSLNHRQHVVLSGFHTVGSSIEISPFLLTPRFAAPPLPYPTCTGRPRGARLPASLPRAAGRGPPAGRQHQPQPHSLRRQPTGRAQQVGTDVQGGCRTAHHGAVECSREAQRAYGSRTA